jgi:hypothetical protein
MKNIVIPEVQRESSLSIIEFDNLSINDKNLYILDLYEIPMEQRTSVDKHILRYYNIQLNLSENYSDFIFD